MLWLLPLLFCTCKSEETILYLSRPGNGSTGSQEETQRYYDSFKSPSAVNARLPGADATLTEWLNNRCFNTPGNNKVEADYYNGTDLGLGRELQCWECPAGDAKAGLISCAVSNHGVPQGLDQFTFAFGDGSFKKDIRERRASIKNALSELTNFVKFKRDPSNQNKEPPLRGATVVFDYFPDRPDKVRMYIYDSNKQTLFSAVNPFRDDPVRGREQLITGLQLDGEGGGLNARVKFIRNCATCHGGRYDEKNQQLLGSSFLDLDAVLFNFGNDTDPDIALDPNDANQITGCNPQQLLALDKLSDFILKVATSTGAEMIVDRINQNRKNNFFLEFNAKGQCVPIPGKTYVPPAWDNDVVVARFTDPQTRATKAITSRDFFAVAVHKYCASCHFSQVKDYNLHGKNGIPLTFKDPRQWFSNENITDLDELRKQIPGATSVDLIRKVACASSDMPHAEVTRNNMKRDSKAFAYICNSEPLPF